MTPLITREIREPQKKSHPRSKRGQRGFALIITLLLMSLLVMIMVSMAALTRVETQIAANYQQVDQARQNTLIALNIALGQLQAAAGPDQRITARAEILDSDPATAAVDTVKQPYWSGVWKTGNASLDDTSNGPAQRATSLGNSVPTSSGVAATKVTNATAWLVSMPTPTTPIDPIAGTFNGTGLTVADNLSSLSASASISGVTQNVTNPTAVILAKQVGRQDPSALPDDTTGFIVAAPLVDLKAIVPSINTTTPTRIGKYAYWISDEGVKAKVNLIDPTLTADSTTTTGATTAQAHFLAPQANAVHKINGLTSSVTTDFRTTNSEDEIKKILTPSQLNFVATRRTDSTDPKKILNPYLPDITTYSQGVLADVKNGGLKKDLTAAFESTAGYKKLAPDPLLNPDPYGYGANMLYRNASGLTIPYQPLSATTYPSILQTDGLQWLELYSYYSIYKSQTSTPDGLGRPISIGTPINPTTTGLLPTLPCTITPRSLTHVVPPATSPSYMRGELVPEMVATRVDVALQSYPSGVNYKLQLRYYPQVVLYNPYNCRLNITAAQIRNSMSVFNGYLINVSVGGIQVATLIPITPNGTNQAMTAMTPNFIEPGESLVFGKTADSPVATSELPIPPATYTNQNPLGYNQVLATGSISSQAALIMDLPVDAVNASNRQFYGTAYPGTPTATDAVTVSLSIPTTDLNTFKCVGSARIISSPWQWPFVIFGSSNKQNSGSFPYTPGSVDFGPISGLSTPKLITGYFYRKKGLKVTASTYKNGDRAVPLYHGNDAVSQIFDNSRNFQAGEMNPSDLGSTYSTTSLINAFKDTTTNLHTTTFGDKSAGAISPFAGSLPPKRVLRDVPGQPLVSIGQFMHMPTSINSVGGGGYGSRSSGSMFIGGSLSSPYIPTDKTLIHNAPYTYILLDDSYLANDTLFDRFYFSTVPPPKVSPTGLPQDALNAQAPQQWIAFADNNTGPTLSNASNLPNSRIKPYYKNGEAPQMSDLRDFDKAAANLLLDGAFNVNSTSIDAWKVLLSSLSGKEMRVYNPDTKLAEPTNFVGSSKPNPIPRFWASKGTGTVDPTTGAWDGARTFSDDEIDMLAKNIVEQVKLRGPFLSMSDFLNRRLGAPGPFTLAGCLQSAIDKSGLNDLIKNAGQDASTTASELEETPSTSPSLIAANMVDGAGNKLNTTVGMPGYLMQQDIVQAFSSAMTVRSDTFVIRAYGESINPVTGAIQAKAWAETVVQRLPEFVDNSSAPDPSAALSALNPTNTAFGRRFKVIGFRWLSPNDL